MNDHANDNITDNYRINNSKTTTSRFFEYKTKIMGKTPINNNTLDTKVVVSLKYLSNFWRSFDLSFSNCIIELDLSWSKD